MSDVTESFENLDRTLPRFLKSSYRFATLFAPEKNEYKLWFMGFSIIIYQNTGGKKRYLANKTGTIQHQNVISSSHGHPCTGITMPTRYAKFKLINYWFFFFFWSFFERVSRRRRRKLARASVRVREKKHCSETRRLSGFSGRIELPTFLSSRVTFSTNI